MWIRTATKRDLSAIQKLLSATWHATYDAIYGVERVNEITAHWHQVAVLEKNLTRPNSEFLVADDGSVIAGMAYAAQIADGSVKLHQIYVSTEFQGQKIGHMLLEEIEQSFIEAELISLEVEEQNIAAIAFYKKCGFIQTGKTANCGKSDSGIAALVFTKTRKIQ